MATTQHIVERRQALRNAGKSKYPVYRSAPLVRRGKAKTNPLRELFFWLLVFVGFGGIGLLSGTPV
jgi:hypothetical protein